MHPSYWTHDVGHLARIEIATTNCVSDPELINRVFDPLTLCLACTRPDDTAGSPGLIRRWAVPPKRCRDQTASRAVRSASSRRRLREARVNRGAMNLPSRVSCHQLRSRALTESTSGSRRRTHRRASAPVSPSCRNEFQSGCRVRRALAIAGAVRRHAPSPLTSPIQACEYDNAAILASLGKLLAYGMRDEVGVPKHARLYQAICAVVEGKIKIRFYRCSGAFRRSGFVAALRNALLMPGRFYLAAFVQTIGCVPAKPREFDPASRP